VKKPRLTR